MANQPPRRAAAPPPPPPPVAADMVNIGDLSSYSGGLGIMPGDWVLYFTAMMYTYQNAQGVATGSPTLGIYIEAYNLHNPAEEPKNQFVSMGRNAHLSLQPHPQTGKSFVRVPGGAGTPLNNLTNWFTFYKSLVDCAPEVEQFFTGDLTILDGMWVHTDLADPPEGRKNMGPRSGDFSDAQQQRSDRKIPVIVEVYPQGKPWEGTGGVPTAAVALNAPNGAVAPPARAALPLPPPPAAAPARPTLPPRPAAAAAPLAQPARPGARPPARPAAAPLPPPPAPTAFSDEDVGMAAVNAVSDVLGANPAGMAKTALRVAAFQAVSAAYGPEMSQAVQEMYFPTDETLSVLINSLGFSIQGPNVIVTP